MVPLGAPESELPLLVDGEVEDPPPQAVRTMVAAAAIAAPVAKCLRIRMFSLLIFEKWDVRSVNHAR